MTIMVLAPYLVDGHKVADAHDLPHSSVITPRSTDRTRGQWFDGLIVVGDARLNHQQAIDIAQAFAHRPDLGERIWQLT
ncbi:hypothetical protein BJF89_01035 [Corynebacterium sp. CNJ-954]|uniref:hypothetical protein n=1 Tax=Corynebacterium sp. CNJ-954 TaxID=1904962 RepID=UPI0009656ED4|nr:hypothetical protein [Corynebacterium sp. CNJ-954]OLT54848.1 hypothetical protein BJF89_01035 [Corynebacterium sp. CNJ-954]